MITPIYIKGNKVLEINGKFLAPNMQWKLNETVIGPEESCTYDISFISNDLIFSQILMAPDAIMYRGNGKSVIVYNGTLKFDDTNPYRILHFLEAPSAELTAWLLANGIKE